MANEPDMWDYALAGIPSPLTDEMESQQTAKQVGWLCCPCNATNLPSTYLQCTSLPCKAVMLPLMHQHLHMLSASAFQNPCDDATACLYVFRLP